MQDTVTQAASTGFRASESPHPTSRMSDNDGWHCRWASGEIQIGQEVRCCIGSSTQRVALRGRRVHLVPHRASGSSRASSCAPPHTCTTLTAGRAACFRTPSSSSSHKKLASVLLPWSFVLGIFTVCGILYYFNNCVAIL